ncbi:acyl transferase [bacterium]|nr:acyl transferase [bacterium]
MLGLLISIYILPVLIWRIFSFFYPLSEKNAYIGKQEKETHSWFISYKLQSLFISFPFFERILILIPGAFSTWLRLWGSQIGHKITWTPRVDIVDRASLEIKDYAIFGDKVYLSAHIIIRKNNRLMLLHKKIKVGEKCLIGYASELGPGANVPDNEMLPALSRAYMNRIIRGGANESAN